tara:strand:+ start:28591 stop:29148 length:558 start_codon:yes stop_codon:yes gene_type:complete
MINFYKANPRVTGTACSFYLNPRDNVFFSTMIKQDSWDDKRRIGSFSKNKDNPSKKVNIKFSAMELAGIIDAFESNREFSGYHGSNQVVKFKFCPYMKDGNQIGFSYSVNKESKEDSTDKTNFIIGFNFAEARLLREHLSYLLKLHFEANDREASTFNPPKEEAPKSAPVATAPPQNEEDDLDVW